jgi:hypothetical protein
MSVLAAFEEIIDISGVAPRIEATLPIGVRQRQLSVRTLLADMCLAQAGHRRARYGLSPIAAVSCWPRLLLSSLLSAVGSLPWMAR